MKSLQKDTFREIKNSKNRFLSIIAIIALGICFFAGVKTTGPSMIHTADSYYQEQRLMDTRLVSTYGFQEADVAAIKASPGVNAVMPGYSADVIIEQGDNRPVIKLISQPEPQGLNQPVLQEGRLPENDGEMLMEMPQAKDNNLVSGSDYKLGDTIKLSSEVGDKPLSDSLNRDSFTIVGFVRSPQFVSIERGSTSIGSGEVQYYGFVTPATFTLERFTEVYVWSQASADGVSAYTPEYQTAINALAPEMADLGIKRLEVNHEDIINKAQVELDKGKAQLNDATQQYQDGIAQGEAALADARAQLISGQADLASGQQNYNQMIADTEAQLTDANNQIIQGEADLAQGQVNLQQELAAGNAQLDQLRNGIAQSEANDPSGQLPGLEAQLTQVQAQINQEEAALQVLYVTQAGIQAQIDELNPTAPDSDYEAQLALLNAQLAQVNSQIAIAQAGLETARGSEAQIQGAIDAIQAFQNKLAGLKDALASGEAALSQAAIDGQQQLDAGAATLETSKTDLANGRAAFEAGKIQGQSELDAGQNKIDQGWADLKAGEAQLAEQKAAGQNELSNATQKLAAAEAEMASIDFGKWIVFNRDDNPGYTSYGEDAQRIDNISGVFPLFFLLVAALVSFTTMTRMVEEQRTQIGTLKALGYKAYQIASKFFIYAMLAGVLGSVIGLLVGLNTLPYFISGAYNLLYQMPELSIAVPWIPVMISCLIAISCTVAAAVVISYIELREEPSQLMRPKAPKIGKRIFLEKIPFIWNRLGFIEKVTARNLMRYKGRFFMTVIGIAGCTALILAGFGLQDAIFSMIPRQFENISVYDGMLAFKTEGTPAEKADIKAQLNGDSRLSGNMLAYQSKFNIEKKDTGLEKKAFVFVPETTGNFNDFIHLQNRNSGEAIDLEKAGVVLSEKVAKDLNLKVGDTIRIYSDDESHEVTLGAITENYLENYIYLSPKVYEEAFGHPLKVNTAYFNMSEPSTDVENAIAKDWLENPSVVAVNFTTNIVKSSTDSIGTLNVVVLILILSAGALAVVVLYNLTNINISERIREIATIRVLGFYDMEVYKYIFRENIVLSIIGIIVGLGLGIILNGFIINSVETDIAMFGRGIEPTSYIYSILITLGFTMLVNVMMTPMIKKISMVESLKSVE
ncbi:FtsX-like permease family protein [Acetobacterium sp.]|uniref:FtsX-like permease family protein n=1 Tax=Acetobacterium sp. TaxID=1872094 RepID=UPI002F3E513F